MAYFTGLLMDDLLLLLVYKVTFGIQFWKLFRLHSTIKLKFSWRVLLVFGIFLLSSFMNVTFHLWWKNLHYFKKVNLLFLVFLENYFKFSSLMEKTYFSLIKCILLLLFCSVWILLTLPCNVVEKFLLLFGKLLLRFVWKLLYYCWKVTSTFHVW